MYKMRTTFWDDFRIANMFGLDAIEDTFNRAFDEWHGNIIYVTELSMVLNWYIFHFYGFDRETAALYDRLWRECDEWCMENLKGEDLKYYLRTTD